MIWEDHPTPPIAFSEFCRDYNQQDLAKFCHSSRLLLLFHPEWNCSVQHNRICITWHKSRISLMVETQCHPLFWTLALSNLSGQCSRLSTDHELHVETFCFICQSVQDCIASSHLTFDEEKLTWINWKSILFRMETWGIHGTGNESSSYA